MLLYRQGGLVSNTEGIVYLLRKTNLTREEIGKLSPVQFNAILNELYYQESVEVYHNRYSTATLLAAIYNTIPSKPGHKALTAKDFLAGDMPSRDGKRPEADVDVLARAKGIKLPGK